MKNFRIYITITVLLTASHLVAGQQIDLAICIDSALANKGNIQAKRTDFEIAKLETSAAWQRYLPELSLNYNYRYNPLIPAQIIPVGQFNPVPTDEKRPIKFGTNWQQTAGVSLYQPIIDFTINSRVEESRINEKIKNSDAEAAERDLITEVLKSFANIWLFQERMQSAALDTLRTFRTRELIMAKSDEGKALRTEINRAIMNHNNALSEYHGAMASLAGEKIYMGYLTGMSLDLLIDGVFDFTPFSGGIMESNISEPMIDSIPSVRNLMLREELLQQQQKSERAVRMPTLGLDGYLGANQYSDNFSPALEGSWYGASYIGLSVRLSILSGTGSSNRLKQLKLKSQGIRSELEDEISYVSSSNRKLALEVRQIDYQIAMASENISLYEENIKLEQERYDAGQKNSYDLLAEEIELRKEISAYNEKQAQLASKKIELLSNSGNLYSFIEMLK
jgi:outer membrane protein TolC